MEDLFFISTPHKHKKNGLVKNALSTIQKNIDKNNNLRDKLVETYIKVFNFLDFDTFAKIKELCSSNEYLFLPTWQVYFSFHNILPKCIKTNKDPIHVIFHNIPIGISKRDEHLIFSEPDKNIDINHSINKSLIRRPYFINMFDIDHANYFKLMKYLILTYYNPAYKYNATKLSKAGQAAAIETNCAYILYEGRKLSSIEECIKKDDEIGIQYLSEELGIKPSLKQMEKIEKLFHEDIYEKISYYFE